MKGEDRRIVEILRAGVWYNEDFDDIENGDIFRMFESEGEIVYGNNKTWAFKAVSDVYLSGPTNVQTVQCEELEDTSDEALGIYPDSH